MNRFFLIPLLALLLALIGCTCSVKGSATMPTAAPTTAPVTTHSPAATPAPITTAAPAETAAPVMPTEPVASPSANATAGN